jgi:hypothetical protein
MCIFRMIAMRELKASVLSVVPIILQLSLLLEDVMII